MLGVQAAFTYDPDLQEVPVRAWAEIENGILSTDPLDLLSCSADLVDEAGAVIATAQGEADPIGPTHARFRLRPVTLVAGQNYLLIVGLRTLLTDQAGPRTFGVPVN